MCSTWGGSHMRLVVALMPLVLKSLISVASTVDRFADDIHFNVVAQLSANLSWAATVLAYQSRPPDPALVGERWRELWIERLEGEPFLLDAWLSHQRRDVYWRHGSICEDFGSFDTPALVLAGLAAGSPTTQIGTTVG